MKLSTVLPAGGGSGKLKLSTLFVASLGFSTILGVSGYTIHRDRPSPEDPSSNEAEPFIDAFGHPQRYEYHPVEKREFQEDKPGFTKWVDSFGQIKYVKEDSFHSIAGRSNSYNYHPDQYMDPHVPTYYHNPMPEVQIKDAEMRGFLAHSNKHIYLSRATKKWEELKREIVISRDCGRAGVLGGRRFFVFCDTEVQTLPLPSRPQDQPYLVSFTANSFAYDYSEGFKKDKAVVLQETGIYDDVGRLAAWVNLYQEESDYNKDQDRKKAAGAPRKERLAIWFESGPAILSNHRAVIYAPIVKVIAETGKGYQYEYLGNTLVNVTYSDDKRIAPTAQRPFKTFFTDKEMNFGSFGSAYFGGKFIYVMAPSLRTAREGGGIMFGRVPVNQVTDRKQYRFYNGKTWEAAMPNGITHADKAVVIPGSFSRGDIIFSKLHGTFLLIYMNGKVDSTFYYRKLLTPTPIVAPFSAVPLDSPEYDAFVEHLFKHPWSTEEEVLLKTVPHIEGEYNYAGSIATGYFGEEDIANGGHKLLLTWTSRSGMRAWDKPTGEYHHGVGYVEFEKVTYSNANPA